MHAQLANAHADMKAARAEALQRDRDLATMEGLRDRMGMELDAVTQNRDGVVEELEEAESARDVLEAAMQGACAASQAKAGESKAELAALAKELQAAQVSHTSAAQQLAGELGRRAQQERLVADLHSDVEALTTSLVESRAVQDVLEHKVQQLGTIRNQVRACFDLWCSVLRRSVATLASLKCPPSPRHRRCSRSCSKCAPSSRQRS
jgi:chromosome segregation ATPase